MSGDNVTKYYWTPSGGVSIDDFVKKFKPSILDQNDAPWVWVGRTSERVDPEAEGNERAKTIGKGQVVVDNLVKRIAAIEKDDKIPTRAKKGVKSKKAVRDEAHAEAAEALKKMSVDSGWTCGKWMIFPPQENVDAVWAKVARSVAIGPLHEAGVMTAKVATSQPGGDDNQVHVVVIYVDNLYDKEQATKVLVSMLEDHGLEPSASKTDLYTLLGIDSKHPSGLRSSIWRPSELIEGGAGGVKDLKAKYKPGSEKNWKAPAEEGDEGAQDKGTKGGKGAKAESPTKDDMDVDKAKEKELKREVSFSDKVEKIPKRSPPPLNGKAAKRMKSAAALFKENDIFASESEDEDEDE